MELLWIVFITLIAVGVAYYVGGYIDRAQRRREEAYQRERRLERLKAIARFARGFAGRMEQRTMIPAHMVPAASRALAQYILDESAEKADTEEWEELCRQIDGQV